MNKQKAQVAIVGAGPIGIELAAVLKSANISYFQFDKGQVAQAIYDFPPMTHFFSSNEKISLLGIPIQTIDQQKSTREGYLAYIRSVVGKYQLQINAFEEVASIEKQSKYFKLTTVKAGEERYYQVEFLVLATGGTSKPRMLHIPGEQLSHVHAKMLDPHYYFGQKVCIIGGRNSAAENALRCYQAGANPFLVLQNADFEAQHVKYWLLPELLSRIHAKQIGCYYASNVIEIKPGTVIIRNGDCIVEAEADFVIKAIGFEADLSLCRMAGVEILADGKPYHHPDTMETNIENLFLLGTVIGGTQKRYEVYIENSHIHVDRIMDVLLKRLNIQYSKSVNKRGPQIPQLEE